MRCSLRASVCSTLLLCGCLLAQPMRSSNNDNADVRQIMSRLVAVGDSRNYARPERLSAGAELAAAANVSEFPEVAAIVGIMVEELAASGAARNLEDQFRTNEVFPVVQVACDIDDAELFAALLPHLQHSIEDTRYDIAARIVAAADLWRPGFNRLGPGTNYGLVYEGLRRGLLPTAPEGEAARVLRPSTWGSMGFWTWLPWSGIPDERVPELASNVKELEYLQFRMVLQNDEAAAAAARELLAALAKDESWLIRGIVLKAMESRALYDPAVLETLEGRADKGEAKLIEGLRAYRRAHNLPVDKVVPIRD